MKDILRIRKIRLTFAEREIVECIQEIGFPHSIITKEAIQFLRKQKFGFMNIFVIDN
jgi:hypothetical protein